MADVDPQLEAAAKALAQKVMAFSKLVQAKLEMVPPGELGNRPSYENIVSHINRTFGLDDSQITKLKKTDRPSPKDNKLRIYLSRAATWELEDLPHGLLKGSALESVWKKALIDCGAAEFRARAAELLAQADSPEPLEGPPVATGKPEAPTETPGNPAPEIPAPFALPASTRPQALHRAADLARMDCHIPIGNQNPEEGLTAYIEFEFPHGGLKVAEGCAIVADRLELRLKLNGESTKCQSLELSAQPSHDRDHRLKMEINSRMTRSPSWHVRADGSGLALHGYFEHFPFAAIKGPLAAGDSVQLIAPYAGLELKFTPDSKPQTKSAQRGKIINQMIKKRALEPPSGEDSAFIVAIQDLVE